MPDADNLGAAPDVAVAPRACAAEPIRNPYRCTITTAQEALTVPKPTTRDDILKRYPWLVSHLICESLGYFTPEGAAGAILAVIRNQPCACEWYLHMASVGKKPLEEIGRDTLRHAIRSRHQHRGFMAEYTHARALVDRLVKTGQSPLFASWM